MSKPKLIMRNADNTSMRLVCHLFTLLTLVSCGEWFRNQIQSGSINSPAHVNAGIVTTLADGADGFNTPTAVTVDSSKNLFVTNSDGSVFKISSTGVVSTFVAAATFNGASGITIDGSGNLYVTNTLNFTIEKIAPGGVVTTIAGSGVQGANDATGLLATFQQPWGIAIDSQGNLFVTEANDHTIRKITPGGVVSTFAGTAGVSGSNDATGALASFNQPAGIAVDSSDNLYVVDANNGIIRMITPGRVVSTFATGLVIPLGITIDDDGNIFVTDMGDNTIKKISSTGVVTILAGSGVIGSGDGTGILASFTSPFGLVADSSGNLYVADAGNDSIRKIE